VRHQLIRAQLAGAYRFGQLQCAQVLAEQSGKTLRIRARRREPQHATRHLPLPVGKQALKLRHAALSCPEEDTEIGEQRRQRCEQ
jgi:hypothetical protein